jgi:hypothetical protein
MNPRSEDLPSDLDLPPSLARALVESDEYALCLRTGEVVRFTRAERQGAFVVLYAPSGLPADPRLADSMAAFPYGLEVRISDIVWCARGPIQAPRSEAPSAGSAVEFQEAPHAISGGVRVPVRIRPAEGNDSPGWPSP